MADTIIISLWIRRKKKSSADLVAQSVKMHRKVNGSLNHAAGGAV